MTGTAETRPGRQLKINTAAALMLVVLAVPAACWWLFGWQSESLPGGEVKTFKRFFGRCTSVSIDVNQDGVIDSLARYDWSLPFVRGMHVNGFCAGRWKEQWEDRNLDGKWDLWIENLRLNDDGQCLARYRVDLDADEVADWEFVAEQGSRNLERIVERRGY